MHAKREPLDARHPVHVMLRTCECIPPLRQRRVYTALRRVLERYLAHPHLRIVHVSLQQNHLHMLVESRDEAALARGMQSFAINCARAINRVFDRHGKVFKFRYHAKQIRTRGYARNALAYVLNNWRRHREDWFNGRERPATIDPYSSAIVFGGWKGGRFSIPEGYVPLPVSPPRTSLLRSDWQWFGLIDPWEIPGPLF